ncbi:PLC-like phosphodiesterase, partial [Dimargaris cristalligena]
MPIDHFHKFLTSAQQEEITLEAAHARLTHFAGRPWLFFPEFSAYVTSFVNAMRNPVAVAPVDASLPLSQYFIKSSHNTYLTGNQFSSKSSIDAYILPLLAGCRSVEIDVLDYKNEPYVYHGYTFTSRIPFKLVLQVIRKYAFVTSDFPLTLSLETHCKAPQQIKMAQYMRDVLGELLVTESLDAEVMDLPSPEQLSRRILIKNKAAAAHDPNSTRPLPDAERHHSAQSSSDGTNSSMPEAKGGPSSSILSKKVKFVSDLAQLNVYHQGSRLPKLPRSSDSPDLGPFQPHFDQIFSLPENKLASYQNDFDRLVRITSTNIIRTFPKYTRVFSGNYNPLSFWAVGSQMVALNYQSFDFHTQMNQALFHPGNRAGYLLKPD